MTESEWRKCQDLSAMMGLLGEEQPRRKLLLFACACIRRERWLDLLGEGGLRRLSSIEEWIDSSPEGEGGSALYYEMGDDECESAAQSLWGSMRSIVGTDIYQGKNRFVEAATTVANTTATGRDWRELGRDDGFGWEMEELAATQWGAAFLAERKQYYLDHYLTEWFGKLRRGRDEQSDPEAEWFDCWEHVLWGKEIYEVRASRFREERAVQCDLFRDIFTNTVFPIRNSAAVRSRITDPIREEARRIYAAHDFSRLPYLAEELRKAGCTNQEVLRHCHQQPVHARGCWVLDLLIGNG